MPTKNVQEADSRSQLHNETTSTRHNLGRGITSVKTPLEILRLLTATPSMTLVEVVSRIGKTPRAIELAASKLVKEGRLKYVGPQKGGHWEVIL